MGFGFPTGMRLVSGDRSSPSHVKRRGIADPSAKAVEFSRMSCLLALLFPKISHERSLTTLVRPLAAACDEASVSIARRCRPTQRPPARAPT